MNQKSGAARSLTAQGFTEKQGQYLAFIYTYAHMFRRPPAEADIQRHFQVTPPSVHQMILTLERNGLIRRQPCGPKRNGSSFTFHVGRPGVRVRRQVDLLIELDRLVEKDSGDIRIPGLPRKS